MLQYRVGIYKRYSAEPSKDKFKVAFGPTSYQTNRVPTQNKLLFKLKIKMLNNSELGHNADCFPASC